jgi:Arc/MetJ-type ribon-helix-helix transcriptional regulator
MPNPSISMPDDMREEIEHRRKKGTSVAEYVRDALDARFKLEDTDNWPPINPQNDNTERTEPATIHD